MHCREAEENVIAVLRDAAQRGSLRGVMHSFCGTAADAAACLELGLHISFAGMLTFRKNDALREIAGTVPLNRLLVETDSPYLAPHPNRGKRNEPAWIRHTAQCLADVHDVSLEEISAITSKNASDLFGLQSQTQR